MLRFFNIEAEVCWQSSCWTYSAVQPGVGTLSCLQLWDAVKSPLRKLSGIARKVLCTAKTEVSWGEKTRRPDVVIFIWAWIYAPSLLETWLLYVIMTRPYCMFSICAQQERTTSYMFCFVLIYDKTTNIIGLMLVVCHNGLRYSCGHLRQWINCESTKRPYNFFLSLQSLRWDAHSNQ